MDCIEEIINIPVLLDHLRVVQEQGLVQHVLDEIVLQSTVEFEFMD